MVAMSLLRRSAHDLQNAFNVTNNAPDGLDAIMYVAGHAGNATPGD
jgi:hypothetical protein